MCPPSPGNRPADENSPLIVSTTPSSPPPPRNILLPVLALCLATISFPLILLILSPPAVPSINDALPGNTTALQNDGFPYRGLTFLAVGDWGREGKHHQRKVARAMARVARRVNLRFIVSTGDNFYEDGVTGLNDPQWRTSFENVYRHQGLVNVPWFSVLGNHDHLGSIQAQVGYSGGSRRWTMPATYYSQEFDLHDSAAGGERVQFVFLDSTPYVKDVYGKAARKKNRQDPSEQTVWFEALLRNSTASKIVLIIHHHMYSMSIAGHFGTREIRAALEPILLRYRHRVLAVISGHEHLLEHLQPYGGPGAWAGSAASHPPPNRPPSRSATPLWPLRMWPAKRKHGHGHPANETLHPNPNNPVIDYFISGSGSLLDMLRRPPHGSEKIWTECCGVLPFSDDPSKPRARMGLRSNGFFVFSISKSKFYAKAYNKLGEIVYVYEKSV